ncbi:MAG: conjugal transfer protein [Actinomycetes bacterium]|jgi:hypothetical protein|nr:MAG: conjugal transfer protein [Actinomycetota bacterium]
MARRSTVQQVAGDHEHSAYPSPELDLAPQGRRGARRLRWSGSGGRWLVWIGRALLWAVLIVILINGVRAPFERFTQGDPSPAAPTPTPGAGFPTEQAVSFASQFAAAYLNFDAANPAVRAQKLKPFLPEAAHDQFGWNGFGKMQVIGIQLSHVEVQNANNAVVTLMVHSGERRWLFSVPVYAKDGRFVVSQRPALLPAPGPAELPPAPPTEQDEATAAELTPQLKGFFEAFASGDPEQLRRYVAAGVEIEGFNGAFTLAQLKQVIVPPGGNTRSVTAIVVWAIPATTPAPTTDPTAEPTDAPVDPPGALEQAYQLTVEKQGDKWFVKDVRGARRPAA